MKREEKEIRETIFNKITVTKEEQKFLTELVDAINDLWMENDEDLRDSWITEFDMIRKLAETGSYEIGD